MKTGVDKNGKKGAECGKEKSVTTHTQRQGTTRSKTRRKPNPHLAQAGGTCGSSALKPPGEL